ncbi:MAG: carbamoyl-phosphate synthase domain-containing protein [Adlercreutzia equolifaciens]
MGEICFNTSLEVLFGNRHRSSYAGQSDRGAHLHPGGNRRERRRRPGAAPALRALVVRDLCPTPSNWRSQESLGDYLAREGVVAIEGIDTVRSCATSAPWRPAGRRFHHGRGCRLAAREVRRSPSLVGVNPAADVSCDGAYSTPPRTCPLPMASPWPPRPSPASLVVVYHCGVGRPS